jgi:hypothetical protein
MRWISVILSLYPPDVFGRIAVFVFTAVLARIIVRLPRPPRRMGISLIPVIHRIIALIHPRLGVAPLTVILPGILVRLVLLAPISRVCVRRQ